MTRSTLHRTVRGLEEVWPEEEKAMKPRRLILTLEVETDAPTAALRDVVRWNTWNNIDNPILFGHGAESWSILVLQAQANVVKARPTKKGKR